MNAEHAVARRVAVGTASNAVGRVVAVISRIAVTPVIVHAVGATDYGIWVLIGMVASWGIILELGISAGLVKYVAEHAAREQTGEAAHIVGAATWVYGLLGGLMFAVGVLLALVAPAILGVHGEDARLVHALGVIGSFDLGLSMLSLAPISVLKGLQRFPAVNVIQGGSAVVLVGMTVAVLEAGAGIVGVSAAGALNTAGTVVASVVVARRLAPGFMAARVRRDPDRVRRLMRFSRSVAAVQVAGAMQSRLDVVIVAAALPVSLVTPYSFGQRLASGTTIASDQFVRVLLPLSTEVSAAREPAAVRTLFLTSTRLTLAIALGVGLPVALLGGPILDIWVGDEFSGYGGIVAILACAAIVDLPSYPAAAVLQSLERHGPLAWMALGSAIANVGLSIALVGPWGVEGVAAGTLIASTVEIVAFVFPYAARVLEVSLWELASKVLLRLVVPGGLLAGALLAGDALVPVDSLPRLVLVVGAALILYALAYAALGAGARERAAYRAGASAVLRIAAPLRARSSRRAEGSPR